MPFLLSFGNVAMKSWTMETAMFGCITLTPFSALFRQNVQYVHRKLQLSLTESSRHLRLSPLWALEVLDASNDVYFSFSCSLQEMKKCNASNFCCVWKSILWYFFSVKSKYCCELRQIYPPNIRWNSNTLPLICFTASRYGLGIWKSSMMFFQEKWGNA